MRKYLLIMISGLALSLPGRAQEEGKGLRVSVVAGLAASQIDGDGLGGYDKAGLIAGAAAKFSFSEKWALQPELLFVQKGSRSPVSDSLSVTLQPDQQTLFERWRVNVIEIPVLVTWQFLPRFSFQAGPGFGYILAVKADQGYGIFEDKTSNFQKVDLTGIAAFEFSIADWLGLNLRYDYSLMPYTKGAPSFYVEPSRPGFYNNSILVSLRARL